MYKYVNAVTHSDCPLIISSRSTVPGQAPGGSLYAGCATGTGMGMGIWIIPDSRRTHATSAGRKWNSRQILGLASVAICMTYNLIRNCNKPLLR